MIHIKSNKNIHWYFRNLVVNVKNVIRGKDTSNWPPYYGTISVTIKIALKTNLVLRFIMHKCKNIMIQ